LNDLLRGPFKSYQQFCDYFDEQLHPHEAKRRYEEYKREYNKKNSRSFFEEHMKEEWFKEKYHPTALEKRRLVRIETARKQAQLFAEELLQKTLNTNINADDYPELLPYTGTCLLFISLMTTLSCLHSHAHTFSITIFSKFIGLFMMTSFVNLI
jgi:uncharacterized protein involved in type VI secretion and phage assembly